MDKEITIAIEPVPVAVTADIPELGLELGKEYTVTLSVSADGTQTALVKEIIPPAPTPTSDLVVFRHVKTGRAYLGQLVGGSWVVGLSNYGTWEQVIRELPAPAWAVVEVVV